MPTFDISVRCPVCRRSLNYALPHDGKNEGPGAGSVLLCGGCAEILILEVEPEQHARSASAEEMIEIKESEIWSSIERGIQVVRIMRGDNA